MTATDHIHTRATHTDATRAAWVQLAVTVALGLLMVEVLFLVITRELIPALLITAPLTAVGVALSRRRPMAGAWVLGAMAVLMLLGGMPFLIDRVPHPASGVDWAHVLLGTVGRVVLLAAVLGAWRQASAPAARRTGTVTVGLAAAIVLVAAVATFATSGDERQPGDVEVRLVGSAFPELVELDAGSVAFVDNVDVLHHTFTVVGTDIDVQVPARQARRVPVDLAPGSYELVCTISGHEAMTTTLAVR
jgi:plastocyanin